MAEEQAAVQEQEPEAIPYQIRIEEAGPATKKVSIEIPPEVISNKLAEQFKTLRREAAVPGFRPGHAPQKLIEKRFHGDVRDQVRRSLISESYEQAVKKHSLRVIGEPQFDKLDELKLPDAGSLTYSFEIEVQPDIILPPLTGLTIKRPKIEVKEEHIDQAMLNLRQQQGALVPVEDRGVEAGDYLIADVHVKVDGNVVSHQHGAQIVARPGRVAGIQIDDLDAKLEGLKPGEKREFTVGAPQTHADEQLRGKDALIEIALKEIKRLELVEINQQFLEGLGFTSEKELREALREQMLERVQYDVQQSMREQINNYLLQNIHIDLPTKLSQRQIDRVVQRRSLDMMMRGVPREQVEAKAEELRGEAKDEALRDLKLFFILQVIADQQKVEVEEPELNGRISLLAAQAGKRPEKVKQEMSADGSLLSMYVQMREQKALDKIVELAQIEEVDLAKEQPKEPEKKEQPPGNGTVMSKINAPRGTADTLPADSWKWQAVEAIARNVAALYHFAEIRTPIFEYTELFHRGVGETTDVVSKETFTFTDRGGDSITLRPEGTAGVVRAAIENNLIAQEGSRSKVFYISPNFRYERPQKGRLRQHHQFGAEAFGIAEPEQDVECILLQMDFYRRCGVKDLALQINSLGDKESKSRYRDALVQFLSPKKSSLSEESQRRLGENPLRILDSKDARDQSACEGAPPAADSLSDRSRRHFQRVQAMLTEASIPFSVNPSLVRGFDYYTETLWEVTAAGLGSQNAIGGGGRYDNLVENLGGRPTPGVGFGIGLERLLIALESQQVAIPDPRPPLVWIVAHGQAAQEASWKLLIELRAAGVAADMDLAGRSIKAQFKLADREAAKFCLVLGDSELAAGQVTLKNLVTGDQSLAPRTEIIARLKSNI